MSLNKIKFVKNVCIVRSQRVNEMNANEVAQERKGGGEVENGKVRLNLYSSNIAFV